LWVFGVASWTFVMKNLPMMPKTNSGKITF